MSQRRLRATDAHAVELEVIAIPDEGWRIRIAEGAPDNPFSLLGFVYETDGAYEVCRIGAPASRQRFDCFETALESLRPSAAEVPAILAGQRAELRLAS